MSGWAPSDARPSYNKKTTIGLQSTSKPRFAEMLRYVFHLFNIFTHVCRLTHQNLAQGLDVELHQEVASLKANFLARFMNET